MQWLILSLLAVYTGVLVYLGRLGRRRSTSENFIHGGRQFSAWQVFFMISALWCSWIFIVEIETAYLFGVSAVWFGVAVGVMAFVSIFLLATPFRRLSYVTNSGILGQRFGTGARTLSGLVIALTFPIFAMSNVLAAAAFLHVVTGWPLVVTLAGTAVVILAYAVLGGIWALAYTQIANFVVMAAGLILATGVALHAAPPAEWARNLPARYLSWTGVGTGTILVWLFSDLLNVVSAQAEFQILTAATDMRVAQRGLNWAMISIAVFTVLSALVGVAVRAGVPGGRLLGVVAFPLLYLHHASAPVVALMTLVVWAAALTWSAPLLFSGAASLGADVLRYLVRGLSDRTRFCVQICLPLQAALVVLYATMRPQDLAWWQVFSLTIRNGAIFAPTVALLVWPVAGRGAAVTSILGGSLAGLAWNMATGFSTTRFLYGLNPMWVGASAGIVLLVGLSLLTARGRYRWNGAAFRHHGWAAWPATGLLALLAGLQLLDWPGLVRTALAGPLVLLTAVDLLLLASLLARPRTEEWASAVSTAPTPG
ncbi:conserved membrane protein of unknown function [Candidatus Hydrogenisulfobacillus filiaventi]|uniref:Sodium:solute symporter n=1 Tax=Candidatus Hydrogenisulfobacillus filiaventi TaxID=2707344 RepID=A0A6F8ZJN3_9FIRM|nr:sodium:solute symporter [Bacillota bacterium]CAB1129874.1 conserved membrane protein of unknown function [Candidatus Hydrogenisulfobacillus filiaventi]